MNKKNKSVFSGLRSFLILWASQSISSLGTAMTNYALVIWAYGQNGTASSVTSLTLFSFLPTILFRFIAGAVADRWDKKRIILVSDFVAACGTIVVFALYASSSLTMAHLYAINFLMSFMNAFQVPAAYVATSLLVPKEQYARAGGLQSVSNAIVSILSPVLGGIVLAWGGMSAVLTIDLITFAIAFLTLLFIRIPKVECDMQAVPESFWQNCLSGLRYLKEHSHLLRLIMFIAAVNFLAKLGADGQLPAFILSKTNGSQTILGMVQSAVALGLLAGGMLVTVMKAPKNSTKAVFMACILIFLAGIGMAISQNVIGWCLTAFLQYLFAAIMNVHWNTLMRLAVPTELQGRVYAARDTVQNCTIPLGLYLGGILADKVFEPLMSKESAMRQMLSPILGAGSGSGIAVLFFLASLIGFVLSLVCMNKQGFQRPKSDPSNPTFPEG